MVCLWNSRIGVNITVGLTCNREARVGGGAEGGCFGSRGRWRLGKYEVWFQHSQHWCSFLCSCTHICGFFLREIFFEWININPHSLLHFIIHHYIYKKKFHFLNSISKIETSCTMLRGSLLNLLSMWIYCRRKNKRLVYVVSWTNSYTDMDQILIYWTNFSHNAASRYSHWPASNILWINVNKANFILWSSCFFLKMSTDLYLTILLQGRCAWFALWDSWVHKEWITHNILQNVL